MDRRQRSGYVARVDDERRLLHRNPARGYTSSLYLAARHEPECVTEAEQRELTQRAHARWRREEQRAWGRAHSNIRRALSEFEHSGPLHPAVLNAAKAVERAAQRVDRRVGLA
jgi:hypothetical protein